jgi:outer membrane protein TolC
MAKLAGLFIIVSLVAGLPIVARSQAPSPGTSLTLTGAIHYAIEHSPSLAASARQVDEAQARVDQAKAQHRITISFNSTATGSNASVIQPPPSQETFGTWQNSISVPVPIGSRPQLAIQQAQAQFSAAQAQYASARLAMATQVASDYYDILRKQALLDIAKEAKTQADQQLSEAQRRYKVGDGPELDILRAQVPDSTADSNVNSTQNDLTASLQALNSAMGRDPDTPVTIDSAQTVTMPSTAVVPGGNLASSMSVVPGGNLADVRQEALDSSADVRAADAAVTAQQSAVRSAHKWREPALTLQASDMRGNDETSFSRQDSVQASVTVPLDDGGLAQAQAREADAMLAQLKASSDAARRDVVVNVSKAYLDAMSAQSAAQSAATAESTAETTYKKTIEGYHNGLFPFSDVLTAEIALNQARAASAQAVYQEESATTNLLLLTGKQPI